MRHPYGVALVEALAHEATVRDHEKSLVRGEFSFAVKVKMTRGWKTMRIRFSDELDYKPMTRGDKSGGLRTLTSEEMGGISINDWKAIDHMIAAMKYALSEQRTYEHVCPEGECEDCRQTYKRVT